MVTTETLTATDLQTAINSLTERRASIAADAQQAAQKLAQSRQALVDGTTNADAVTAAQSRATALQGTLNELDARIGTLTAECDQTRANEDRAAKVARTEELTRQVVAMQAEMDSIMEEMNATVQPLVSRLLETIEARGSALQERRRIGIELGTVDINRRNEDRAAYPAMPSPHGAELWMVVQATMNRRENERRREAVKETGRHRAERANSGVTR